MCTNMKRWLIFFFLIIVFFRWQRVGEESGQSPGEEDLSLLLNAHAEGVEAEPERWMYSNKAADFKDCSGMFIRLCEEMEEALPPEFDFPSRAYRGTRDLARWYAEHGDLQLIRDPQVNSNKIQVGQIMFYGRAKTRIPKRFDLATLTAPYPRGLLAHLGVVVAVDRAADGQLLSYTLFHGRSSGKPASRSVIRTAQNPNFGNWGQPWLAVASLLHAP